MPILIQGSRVHTVIIGKLDGYAIEKGRACSLLTLCQQPAVATVLQITDSASTFNSAGCARCIALLLEEYCGAAEAPVRKPVTAEVGH